MDASVEADLAEDAPAREVGQRGLVVRGEDAERDRQVEGGPLFPDAGRSEVHRHATGRVLEAGVPERGADAVARLAHRPVGQADGGRVRQPGGDVDFDVDDQGVDAAERAGANASEHAAGVPERR